VSGLSTNPGGPILGRWEKPFEMLLGSATALILACIMLITCVDVAGRYVLQRAGAGRPGSHRAHDGGADLRLAALVTLRNQQVTIDLFEHLIPKGVKPPCMCSSSSTGGLCLAVIAWRLWVKGGQMISRATPRRCCN
jgi:TRAP-type C4-dicarboxylate transport system permease small subunit